VLFEHHNSPVALHANAAVPIHARVACRTLGCCGCTVRHLIHGQGRDTARRSEEPCWVSGTAACRFRLIPHPFEAFRRPDLRFPEPTRHQARGEQGAASGKAHRKTSGKTRRPNSGRNLADLYTVSTRRRLNPRDRTRLERNEYSLETNYRASLGAHSKEDGGRQVGSRGGQALENRGPRRAFGLYAAWSCRQDSAIARDSSKYTATFEPVTMQAVQF